MSNLKEICKEQTEMIDEMRQNIKELTEENEKLSEQYNKMIAERNSLIDDLSWYKAKVNRLERHNKDLRLQSDTYFEQWQNEKLTSQGLREQCKEYAQDASKFLNLLSEFSQHIGNKPSSSAYKYFRAKLDNLNITEDK